LAYLICSFTAVLIAYNLWRRLVLPKMIDNWPLPSLQHGW
jgi:hypothetical protein